MFILISIKDYIKKNNITDSAVRKQIKRGKIESVIMNDKLYLIQETNEITKLKDRVKLLNQKIKALQNKEIIIEEYKRQIQELKEDLKTERNKKDKLYESFIGETLKLTK